MNCNFSRFASASLLSAVLVLCACSGTTGGVGGGGAGTGGSGVGGGTGGAAGGGSGGNGGSGGAGGGNAGLPQSMLCDQFAAAVCARELTCKYIDPAQSTQCLAVAKNNCTANVDKLLTAGARTYDGVKGQACITAITATRCIYGQSVSSTGTLFNLPTECSLLNFAPKGTLNTPCTSTSDCVQGYCGAATGDCAKCLPFVGVNAACNFTDKRCDPDAGVCTSAGDGGQQCNPYIAVGNLCNATVTCDPKTGFCPTGNNDAGLADGGARNCSPKLADGQPCNFTSSRCQSAYCGFFADAGSICGYRPLGAGCTSHGSCGPNNYCKGYLGFPAVDGVCTARVAAGGACTNQYADTDLNGDPRDGCLTGSCLGGTCKAADFTAAANAECDRQIGNCTEDLYCKDFDAPQADGGASLNQGTCVPRLDADAGCDYGTYFDLDCKSGSQCDNDNFCNVLKSPGGACQGTFYCKDLLTCQRDAGPNGACIPWQAPGSDCTPIGTTCASGSSNERTGFCLYDGGLAATTGVGACSALLGANAACNSNTQCVSGRCRRPDGGVGGFLPNDGGVRELGACVTACLP